MFRNIITVVAYGSFLTFSTATAVADRSFSVSAFDTLPISATDNSFTMEIKVGLSDCDLSQPNVRVGWSDEKIHWQFSSNKTGVGEQYGIYLVWDKDNPNRTAQHEVFRVGLSIREKFQELSSAEQNSIDEVVIRLLPFRFQCLIGNSEERQLRRVPNRTFNYFPFSKSPRVPPLGIDEAERESENWHPLSKSPRVPPLGIDEAERESENWHPPANTKKRRRISISRCGLGWSPQSQYHHHENLPKVMIYALEFECNSGNHIHAYRCQAIEIRTGDDVIENLTGWQLYLGTLYNPSLNPVKIPEAHSHMTDRILRITPEMLGLETFPCNTVNASSHPLPGFHYVLKTDENVLVDTAYSCFLWGLNATTTVNRVNVKSPRRVSSAALREMETPRLERYISNIIGVSITYMDIEAFTWDRVVLSDWLLAANEETVTETPNAPSLLQRNLGTTWGALKK